MAIDRTGISSLDTGAPEITYSGNEGPKSPQEMQQMQMQQMQMAQLQEEYKKYVFEMEEQGLQPMSMQQFMEQALAEGQMSSREQGGTGDMAMKSGLIDEYRNYKMGQGDAGEQFMSPRDYYRSQEQDRAGVAYGGTANPTYTQSRKQRMAYGGIAGLDGRKRYGVGSWFQEKIMDPIKKIIPNEIKNPAALATIAGLGLNQFGVPFTGKTDALGERIGDRMGQNWIGDLIDKDLVYGQGGDQTVGDTGFNILKPSTWLPGGETKGLSDAEKQAQVLAQGTSQGDYDIFGNKIIEKGAEALGLGNIYDKFTDFMGPNEQGVNWKTPLAIGSAMGLAQSKIPQAQLPTDTSGIDMASAIRGDNLRFRPRDEVLAASGGRIGYDNGGVTADASGVMSQVSPSRKTQIEGNQIAEDAYNEIFQKFYEKFPGIATGEETIEEMIAMLQAEGVMETENLGILGLDRSMDMITPESAERSARRISMGDTQYGDIPAMAQGGRIGAEEGGLMNLGGMEKDYRAEGGFVPIGGQEKADDVPARLSKNEFVFTADAVRSAGGGDIDAGAEVMENVMNNLEQGGQISQESQGLEGARNMFATAQRLGEVM